MPAASFGSGLTAGILSGWSQQQQRKDELARNQRQQDINNYLTMAQSDNIPDEQRQWALEQATGLMQGKKAGKAGGAPNGIIQRLARMLGVAHGNGQPNPQGQPPMSEQIPGGQGTSTTPSLPGRTNPDTGRPTIRTPQNEEPIRPQQNQPNTVEQQPVQPSYEDQLRNRLTAAQKSGNQFAIRRAQEALDKYQVAKEGAEFKAESAREIAQIRGDNARDIAELKRQQAEDLQKMRDSDAKDKAKQIEDMKAQHAKDLEDLRAQHKKDLEDLEAKNREALKKTVPGKAAATDRTPAQQKKLFDSIENWHQQQYAALDKQLAEAKTKKTMTDSQIANLRKTRSEEIEKQYREKITRAGGSASGQSDDRVSVTAPNGRSGSIPRSQLDQWNKMTPEQQNAVTQKQAA